MMKKLMALLMPLAIAAVPCLAQFSKVEYEMGQISFDKVSPILEKLKKSNAYLKPAEVSEQLITNLNQPIKIEVTQPGKILLPGTDLFKQLKKSTVVLVSGGIRATGYFIDKTGILVTNYHVLQMFGDTSKKDSNPLLAMTADEKFYPVTAILASSKINDIAIIKIAANQDQFQPLPLSQTAEEGTDVFVMGHPAHMIYYFTKGIVAKNFIRNPSNPKIGEDFRMAITADYSLGESGGPVVNSNGNLVGMVSSATALFGDHAKTNPQMIVKSAIPVIAIKQLIL